MSRTNLIKHHAQEQPNHAGRPSLGVALRFELCFLAHEPPCMHVLQAQRAVAMEVDLSFLP